jgi:hypothetical protein
MSKFFRRSLLRLTQFLESSQAKFISSKNSQAERFQASKEMSNFLRGMGLKTLWQSVTS